MVDKINPVEHATRMYEIFRTHDRMTHEQALFRALCVACEEQRGRCEEACEEVAEKFVEEHMRSRPDWFSGATYSAEGARKAAEAIRKMPPPNVDKDGILR